MILDSHAHLVSADFERYPPSPLHGQLDRKLDDPVTAERLLQLMDEQGVQRAVVVQRVHVYGFNNDYVCDSAARYADRLVPVVGVDADAADAPRTIERWVKERGAVGIRITERTKGGGTGWLDSPQALAAWQAATELGVSVCLHMYRWNRAETLAALPAVLAQVPQARVVLDHLSNLLAETADHGVDAPLLQFAANPRVFLKLTTINFHRFAEHGVAAAPVLQRVVQAFGADRVMWGSDVAQSPGSYAEMLKSASDALVSFSAAERGRIFGGTALEVYDRAPASRTQ